MMIIMLVISIGVVLVSVQALKALPRFIQRIIVSSVILSFLFNFAISSLITMFIGAGMVAGAANLLGSIVFAIYCMWYKRQLESG